MDRDHLAELRKVANAHRLRASLIRKMRELERGGGWRGGGGGEQRRKGSREKGQKEGGERRGGKGVVKWKEERRHKGRKEWMRKRGNEGCNGREDRTMRAAPLVRVILCVCVWT